MATMDIENYKKELSGLGSKPGLDVITELLNKITTELELSEPLQDLIPAIHIAGTNGKGSSGTMIAAAFTQAGFKVGHFSSPAVMSYEEMFRIDGEAVSDDNLEKIFSLIESVASKMETHPTLFEVETAAAFLYFYRNNCDINVIECGMGGRLDATNVMSNKLANVFTPIGYDHMSFLGNTIQEIALQKAGIMCENVPGIMCQSNEDVMETLASEAERIGTPLLLADSRAIYNASYDFAGGIAVQRFEYDGHEVTIHLAGTYQRDNAILAIKTIQAIGEIFPKYKIDFTDINEGISKVQMPGRFELINKNPLFYIDGAHNPAAACRLRESIQLYFTNRRLIFIIGVLADKEYDKVLSIMAPLADEIYTITPPSPRALCSVDLALEAMKYSEKVKACESIYEAVQCAISSAESDDIILAFGSLSYLSEIKNTVGEYNG